MKSLDEQTDKEKAKLLHQLFPDEIRRFIVFAETQTKKIISSPDALRENWQGDLITVEVWVELAERARAIFDKYKQKLDADSSLFADQLFDAYQSMLTRHCLQQFNRYTGNQRFIKTVHAFFDLP